VFCFRLRGGEGGIRTPGTLSGTPVFKTGAINHSATSPSIQFYYIRNFVAGRWCSLTSVIAGSLKVACLKGLPDSKTSGALFRAVWIDQNLAGLASL
jgi:hypothetical protein